LKIEESGLVPDTLNANEGTQRGLGLLEKSLRKLGAGRSILADKNGNVIAGNKTLERAADIDLPVRIVETDGNELVVVKRTDLDLYSESDTRARQLAYADNKIAELDLAWKPDQIAVDFEPLELGEWGFDNPNPPVDAEPQIDRAAELNEKWQVVTGDLWQIGEHRLLCGDSTIKADVERVMGGEKADLMLTDPPYGIGYQKNGSSGTSGWKNYGKIEWDKDRPPKETIISIVGIAPISIIWGGNYFSDYLVPSMGWLVWDKGQRDFSLADCELAWTSRNKAARVFSYSRAAALQDGKEHPTQKPVSLFEWCIELEENCNVVVDFFCGSGTTMVACENLHRKCRAIEISPNYCAVILERMSIAFPGIVIQRFSD
jgi:site-specific DNA-methyltransferase (adenine-specific)